MAIKWKGKDGRGRQPGLSKNWRHAGRSVKVRDQKVWNREKVKGTITKSVKLLNERSQAVDKH